MHREGFYLGVVAFLLIIVFSDDIGLPLIGIAEAGTSFDNVVKTTCFLKEMSDFAAFNKIYGETFTSKPARSCVAVKTLPKDVLVEVEVIAVI